MVVTHIHDEPLSTAELHRLVQRNAWRRRPPSEKQLTLLRRLGVDPAGVTTKGQAADLIGRAIDALEVEP